MGSEMCIRDRRLVHCDLSPGNVMVSTAGEVKLIDFGVAVRGRSSRGGKVGFGKPGYSSPEQLFGTQRVDSRADIFSLGVVFFELLTGRRMFPGVRPSSFAEHVKRLERGDHPLPSHVNAEFELFDELVSNTIRVDPIERYPSALAFGRALRRALERESATYSSTSLGGLVRDLAPLFEAEPTWRYGN